MNPSVNLRTAVDSTLAGESVLLVEYPPPSNDPAARDVRLDAQATDWSAGKALTFRVRAAHATRLSVSFIDRNRVVYTSLTNISDVWQTVRIDFATIRPNQYFQPPDAKTGAPLDVSDVRFVAFAPQDPLAGRLAVSEIILAR